MGEREERALSAHLALVDDVRGLLGEVDTVARALITVYESGGRVLTCGNGGSAADAQHLAAELVGRYRRERRPLTATALGADPSTLTSIGNDYSFEDVFARQVEAHARAGDAVVGFTTSGRSANVVRALETARAHGATTILFGGGDGPPASDHADHALVVRSSETARVQEMHVLLLHLVVEQVDSWAAGCRAVDGGGRMHS